jgi:hypothetical protein
VKGLDEKRERRIELSEGKEQSKCFGWLEPQAIKAFIGIGVRDHYVTVQRLTGMRKELFRDEAKTTKRTCITSQIRDDDVSEFWAYSVHWDTWTR